MNAFYQQVYDIVSQIPRGKVVSYGQIARLLCRPRAAREVGRAMRFCPPDLPWQEWSNRMAPSPRAAARNCEGRCWKMRA